MSTKKGKAVPLDREIPDGTAVISVVHPEGNPAGVTVEETVVKDNTSDPRPNIGTNVGEALEKALQKSESKPSTKTKKENQKMENATKTTPATETTTEAKPKAKQKQPQPKAEAVAPAPKAEQPTAAEAAPQLGDMLSELKTLKEGLGSTKIEVEHFRRTDNTGRECGHQFLVGLATGAGVALGVTVISTAAWLIQRKLSGGDSSAE